MKLNVKGDKYLLKCVKASRIPIGVVVHLLVSADCIVKVGRTDPDAASYSALRLHIQQESDEAYNCVVEIEAEDEFEKIIADSAVFLKPTIKPSGSRWVWYEGICVIKAFLKDESSVTQWINQNHKCDDHV